ncbi:hypothetical protein [Ruania albidiflava]|uniref:hypothetical protein n=1 Tax=Ruania albidiflava TaxID=366586 RepID=UPI0003B74C27|nr:hypothetical protein [Ruania albidiflava]
MSSETLSQKIAPHEEFDGVLALRALLRAGLDVEVYPRQVVYAPARNGVDLSFVHGIPGSSGLGPVTYAQDKRMQRGLLERHGVPVPRSATFTMGRGISGAKRFARKVGYPVLVKPAVGDNGIETFRNIRSSGGIDAALDYLRTPPSERPGFSRAAYGLTELREPGEENGRIVVPPGYMFMVEKQLEGTYLRVLVSDGEVRSIIQCEGVPTDESFIGGTEILGQTHPSLNELALRAVAALPGLSLAAIDFVVENPVRPVDEQDLGVVELSERPALWVQARVDPTWAEQLAEDLVRRYATAEGHSLPEPRPSVSVTLEAHALPDATEGGQAIVEAATARGLQAEVTDVDQTAGTVYAKLSGDAGIVAHLVNEMLNGSIDEQRVMLAVVRPS